MSYIDDLMNSQLKQLKPLTKSKSNTKKTIKYIGFRNKDNKNKMRCQHWM